MACVISTALLQALLCVWLAALLATAAQQRADAEQENFETVSLVPDAGDPSSTLFSNCIAASKMIDAKVASIQLDGSVNEWVRMVPDSTTLQESITWTNPPASTVIASIVDCAAAANEGGKKMFKYGGGTTCMLSDVRYSFNVTQACETDTTDAVFVI